MRNIVTGGAGFLGSYIVDRLIKNNHEVICIDNFITGKLTNISQHLSNPNFKLIKHDLIKKPEEISCDRIWHMACPASPVHYQENPLNTAKTNFLATYNMLNLAANCNATFLMASSSEIYGNPLSHPQSEDDEGSCKTSSIRACYSEGKRMAETLCFDFNRVHNVNIKVARIFNTYGPRMQPNDGRVITNFIFQCLKNQSITIYGDGSQTRSFCFIDDMIEGLFKLMDSNYQKPINLGSTEEYCILELAQKIRKKINSQSAIIQNDLPANDPLRRKPNIDLAIEKLNWESKTSLDKGLDKTINFFKQNIQ